MRDLSVSIARRISNRAGEAEYVAKITRATAEISIVLGSRLSFIIALLAGCDSSTAVKEIPEHPRKRSIQRKVDVTPGTGKIIARRRRLHQGPRSGR